MKAPARHAGARADRGLKRKNRPHAEAASIGSGGGCKRQRDRLLFFNQRIAACAQRKQLGRARDLYGQLQAEGLEPSGHTFGALVNCAVRAGDLRIAQGWLDEMASRGLPPNVVASTTLLKGLCASGAIGEARELLERMALPDGCGPNLRSVNTFLRGCVRTGEVALAAQYFRKMKRWGLTPDFPTYDYVCGLLCQGLRTAAVRRLLRQLRSSITGFANGTEFAGLSRLWALLAEASLLRGDPLPRARAALRRAKRLRRRASKQQGSEDGSSVPQFSSSVELFEAHRLGELDRQLVLLASHVDRRVQACADSSSHSTGGTIDLGRLLVISSGGAAPTTDNLLRELRRSFGLRQIIKSQPEGTAARLQARLDAAVAGGHLRPAAALSNTIGSCSDNGGGWSGISSSGFSSKQLALKIELGAGEGEWGCAQAQADSGRAIWACVELRRDRAFRALSRAYLVGVSNLIVISGDAGTALNALEPGAATAIFVNFPEPPLRRGSGSDEDAPHLLTEHALRAACHALRCGGTLCVVSDHAAYLEQVARTVDEVGGFEGMPGSGDRQLKRTTIERGLPGESCGAPIVSKDASSYFDRLWKNGRFVRRWYILVRRR